MAYTCSFKNNNFLRDCGPSLGYTEVVFLNTCREDVKGHLQSCHLSRSDLQEHELILQRAGLEHMSSDATKTFRVCPRHRYGLGKFWRPPSSCQYQTHSGSSSIVKGWDVIGQDISREINNLFGITVPLGSSNYKITLINAFSQTVKW